MELWESCLLQLGIQASGDIPNVGSVLPISIQGAIVHPGSSISTRHPAQPLIGNVILMLAARQHFPSLSSLSLGANFHFSFTPIF